MIGQRTGTRGPTMPFHECDICHKEFTRQWNLERHKLIHESDSGTEGTELHESEPKSMLQTLADGEI